MNFCPIHIFLRHTVKRVEIVCVAHQVSVAHNLYSYAHAFLLCLLGSESSELHVPCYHKVHTFTE